MKPQRDLNESGEMEQLQQSRPLPGWLGQASLPQGDSSQALLPGASSQDRGQLSHTPLPRHFGAPGETITSFTCSSILPGAGRCHLTVSSNPSRTGHLSFLTPREEHIKGSSPTETEARAASPPTPRPPLTAPISLCTRGQSCTKARCRIGFFLYPGRSMGAWSPWAQA